MALANHRTWLLGQAEDLFRFLSDDLPIRVAASTISTNAYAIAYLIGQTGAGIIVDRGISFGALPDRVG
jgi:hypothetical protein